LKILIISEPRTGSSNLIKWFKLDDRFTIFRHELNINKINIQKDYKYNTDFLLVLVYYNGKDDLNEYINYFDKIICLYRENNKLQLESYVNSVSTFNWESNYLYKKMFLPKEELFLKNLKKRFKENFLKKYFSISYEELYNDKNVNKLINFIGIESCFLDKFPIGKKYRVDKTDVNLI